MTTSSEKPPAAQTGPASTEPPESPDSPDKIEQTEPLEPSDSPCQLVCSMEPESGYCYGCGRSRDEIAYWPLKSRAEREAILAALPERMPPLQLKLAEQRSKRRVNKRNRPTSSQSAEVENIDTS